MTPWSFVKMLIKNRGNSAKIAPAAVVQRIAIRVAAQPERIARLGSRIPSDCPTSAADAAENPTHGRNESDSS